MAVPNAFRSVYSGFHVSGEFPKKFLQGGSIHYRFFGWIYCFMSCCRLWLFPIDSVGFYCVPRFKIKHEGPEEWGNMWQKSRAIWKYINFHYKDDFDWFILGGDDIFIIVENLRKVLLQPLECFCCSQTEQQ